MDKLRRVLAGHEDDDEERGLTAEIMDGMSWSWSTRVKGFIACFALGWVFTFLGTFCLWLPLHNSLVAFAVFFTFGNIVSVFSTFFLMGPMKQLKKMAEETRIIATAVMVLSVLLTLLAAFHWKKRALCLLFVIMQFCAMLWYSLSFIPYARNAVKSCLSGILG
ncbi:unnamed protein product [Notodromas monacha]|uniref:Vesicle transport protein n=1 Tax=Notodromas monacha TaxID=399045 RepID=A0A7R9BNH7_9CRUS|nr:unnamed protein product [Notodromas monacha]CAG0917401.1 unnamed protein product [Notodromas monacha]